MGMLLVLRFAQDLPAEIIARLGGYCHASGPELSVLDVEKAPIEEIAAAVLPFRDSLVFGPYFVPDDDADFTSADIVGAVLGPGEVQGCGNSASDFDPAWPAPCLGLVKEGVPIECRSKPTGHLEMIGDNLVFSARIVRLLGSDKAGRRTHPVRFRNRLLEDWTGFRLHQSCNVVSSICFSRPRNCALCRTPFTPWRGVWICKSTVRIDGEVCVDESGYEHHQSRHPIVVSKKVAVTLEKALGGRGFSLEPVYALTSEIGRRITVVCSSLRGGGAESSGNA